MPYDTSLTEPRDQVRLLIGDVTTSPIFTDDELDFFLGQNANIYYASALVLESLAARYAGAVDKQVGDLRIKYSDKSKQYLTMAATLRSQFSRGGRALIYFGGQSVSEHTGDAANTDLVQPAFTKDMHSYTDPILNREPNYGE